MQWIFTGTIACGCIAPLNKRVTAFLGLYRRLRDGWPEERAFALLRQTWKPDAAWSEFIASQLAKSNAA